MELKEARQASYITDMDVRQNESPRSFPSHP